MEMAHLGNGEETDIRLSPRPGPGTYPAVILLCHRQERDGFTGQTRARAQGWLTREMGDTWRTRHIEASKPPSSHAGISPDTAAWAGEGGMMIGVSRGGRPRGTWVRPCISPLRAPERVTCLSYRREQVPDPSPAETSSYPETQSVLAFCFGSSTVPPRQTASPPDAFLHSFPWSSCSPEQPVRPPGTGFVPRPHWHWSRLRAQLAGSQPAPPQCQRTGQAPEEPRPSSVCHDR